jgi:hypothetical protein
MVQTTYLGDQKHDFTQLRHNTVNSRSAFRRRKGMQAHCIEKRAREDLVTRSQNQNRRDGEIKSPAHLLGPRKHQVLLYVDHRGKIGADSSSTITGEERRKILQAALPNYREALERIDANSTQPSSGTSKRHDFETKNWADAV